MPSLLQRGESKSGWHGEARRYPDKESTVNPIRVLCAGHLYHALSRPLLCMCRHSDDYLPSARSQRHILFCGLQETEAQGPSASDLLLQRPPDWPRVGVLPQHGRHHVVEAFRILGVAPSSTTNADLGAQQKTSHRHSFLMLRRIIADRRLEHMRALVQLPFIWMSSQDAALMRGSMANGGAHSQQGARLPGHWTEHSTTSSVDNMAQFLLRNPSRAQRVQ